jgi:RNA polymerase sigma-70 factor (ECF subfamily)
MTMSVILAKTDRMPRGAPREGAGDVASDRLAACLARVALGDRQAFHTLYELTSARLLALAHEILHGRERAEEVLQEAYLSVWHLADRYEPAISRPMTWLINIVRNRAIDALRAQRSRRHLNLPLDDDDESEALVDLNPRPEQQYQRALTQARVCDALERLASCERQALALVIYRGMSHADIAAQCHVPLGTAKSWVRRGLAHLKEDLDAAGTHAHRASPRSPSARAMRALVA